MYQYYTGKRENKGFRNWSEAILAFFLINFLFAFKIQPFRNLGIISGGILSGECVLD